MAETKMKLRSSVLKKTVLKEIPEEANTIQPFIKYQGKIHYYTDSIDCAIACDKIITKVKESSNITVMGFDMEWPFSFQSGPGKTALIQINPSLDECYLFHVFEFRKLPMALVELLSCTNVRLSGVNIKNDIHKLARDFPGIDSKPMLDNCIDLRTQANSILEKRRCWSMATLVEYFLKKQVNKDRRVRCSKWNEIPLSQVQIKYAAIDSYVSLKLYLHLKEIEKEETNEITLADILD